MSNMQHLLAMHLSTTMSVLFLPISSIDTALDICACNSTYEYVQKEESQISTKAIR
jgi:hypothetical protein